MIIQFAVRTFGPILLRGGLGGGATATTNTRTKTDDFDDFDDFGDDDNEVDNKSKSKVNISLPTFAPDSAEDEASSTVKNPPRNIAPARINLLDTFNDDQTSAIAQSQTTTLSPFDSDLVR